MEEDDDDDDIHIYLIYIQIYINRINVLGKKKREYRT